MTQPPILTQSLTTLSTNGGCRAVFDYVTEIRNRVMHLADGFHPGLNAEDIQSGLRRRVSGSHVHLVPP